MTHLLENQCPHCGHRTDRARSVFGDHAPSENDLSLCFECGEWSVFGADLALRAPTDDEFAMIGEETDCRRARAAWVAIQQRTKA